MDGYTGFGTKEKLTDQGTYRCLRISDLTEMGMVKGTEKTCEDENYLLKEGDILFARVGSHTFKSYRYDPADGPLAYASFLMCFHVEKDNPRYIQYYALSHRFQKQVLAKSSCSTRNVISAKDLQRLPLPHPDRAQQDRIVEILAPVYESYANAYRKEMLLDSYAQECFANRFTPGKQEGYVPLSSLAIRKNGKVRQDAGGPVPIYNSGGVTGGLYESMPEQEAILVPKKGSLNNVFYVSRPFWASITMAILVPKRKEDLYYLYCLLRSCDLMALNADSIAPGIHMEMLDNLLIPVYSEEKKKDFFNDMEPVFSEIGILRKKQRTLRSLFYTLSDQIF